MAVNPKTDPKDDEKPEEPMPLKSSGMLVKLIVLSGFLLLVLVNTTILVFLLPSGRPVVIEGGDAPEIGPIPPDLIATKGADPGQVLPPKELQEVEVGEPFSVMTRPASKPETAANFKGKFFMKVPKKDLEEYNKVYDENKMTIRAEISKIIEKASEEDKLDPNITMIANRIQEKVNGILGKPYVKEVGVFNKEYEPAY